MISVVIPAYNEEKFIGTVLHALAAQEIDEPVEVVIADARSRDKTREIAKGFREHFADLRIVEGGMPAVGRNAGAKASKGETIVFLDADMDLLDRNFLARNVGYFRLHRLAGATTRIKPLSQKVLDRTILGFYNLILRPVSFVRPLGAMCIVVSREAFEKTGGYPEDVVMAEDHEFALYCSMVGRYGILPVPAYFNVRRLEKEGRWGLVFIYLKAAAMRTFSGPIKEFHYEFGHSEKN